MIARVARLLLVKDSERGQVLYFLVLFLLIGAGMALGRGTTDALFFKRYGIEYLPVMYLLLSALLMAVSMVYAALSDQLPAERFFRILFNALVVVLVGNWALMAFTSLSLAYPLYFLIYEIASELLLVHAALYLSQNLDTLQAKRLMPLVLAGWQVGIVIGGLVLATVAPIVGVANILMFWGAILLVATAMVGRYHRRIGTSPHFRAGRKSRARLQHSINQVTQGVRFIGESDLLRALSMALFFMVITFYVLCYSVNRVYTETFATEESLTAFFGTLTAVTSSIALLLQIFVTNRVLRRYGVKHVNMIFPLTTMVSYAGLLVSFTFPLALVGSLNKDALMPAFRNPVRNLFFNALPGYMQGRARAMSVALVLPLALATTGGLLLIAQRIDNPIYFLLIGVGAGCGYIYYSTRMNRAYVSGIISVLRQKVFLPAQTDTGPSSAGAKEVLDELQRGISHTDDDISFAYAKAMCDTYPEQAGERVLPRLASLNDKHADQLVRKLAESIPSGLAEFLLEHAGARDAHLQATIITALSDLRSPGMEARIAQALDDDNPRLAAAGVHGAIGLGDAELVERAEHVLVGLLASDSPGANIAALQLLARHPAAQHTERLLGLLDHAHPRVVGAALDALYRWPRIALPGFEEPLTRIYRSDDPELRHKTVRCFSRLPIRLRLSLAEEALEDDHPVVRRAAVGAMFADDEDAGGDMGRWIAENRASPRAQVAILETLLARGPNPEQLKQIAYGKARDAHDITLARSRLAATGEEPSGEPSIELLAHILDERQKQLLDLALLAMEHVENHDVIAVIRAGLTSGDPRHVANAIEALRNINDKRLADLLGDLLEDLGEPEQAPADTSFRFETLKDILTWCAWRSDPWLKACADQALERLEAVEA